VQSLRADERYNVQIEMLPVLVDGAALKASRVTRCQPMLASRCYGDCVCIGNMDTARDLDMRLSIEGDCVLLELERLDVALAVLVAVVNDPCGSRLSVSRPLACSDSHTAALRDLRI